METTRRSFLKGLAVAPVLVAATPILTLGQGEKIYWLLTAKAICAKIVEIDRTSQADSDMMVSSLRAREIRRLLRHREQHIGRSPTLAQKAAWLQWAEGEYARALEPENHEGILYLAEKYKAEVFYRASYDLGARRHAARRGDS